jgi:hypothetical protein
VLHAVTGLDQSLTIITALTGPGISEHEQEAATKRFYRSDKSRCTKGLGLGLSLVAAIVKLHGFRLTITAGPGCTAEIACPQAHCRQTPNNKTTQLKTVAGVDTRSAALLRGGCASSYTSLAARPTCSHKIQFSFVSDNSMVPAGLLLNSTGDAGGHRRTR